MYLSKKCFALLKCFGADLWNKESVFTLSLYTLEGTGRKLKTRTLCFPKSLNNENARFSLSSNTCSKSSPEHPSISHLLNMYTWYQTVFSCIIYNSKGSINSPIRTCLLSLVLYILYMQLYLVQSYCTPGVVRSNWINSEKAYAQCCTSDPHNISHFMPASNHCLLSECLPSLLIYYYSSSIGPQLPWVVSKAKIDWMAYFLHNFSVWISPYANKEKSTNNEFHVSCNVGLWLLCLAFLDSRTQTYLYQIMWLIAEYQDDWWSEKLLNRNNFHRIIFHSLFPTTQPCGL